MSAQSPFRPFSISPPPKPSPLGRRAVPRVRLFIPAEAILLQGHEKCVLEDLSQHGARIMLGGRTLRPGYGMVIQTQALDAFATVIWGAEQRFGLQFDEVLPLPSVIALREFADTYVDQAKIDNARATRIFGRHRPGLRSTRSD